MSLKTMEIFGLIGDENFINSNLITCISPSRGEINIMSTRKLQADLDKLGTRAQNLSVIFSYIFKL
jgi:hypothetical protein